MGYCKDCRWWQAGDTDKGWDEGWGECDMAKQEHGKLRWLGWGDGVQTFRDFGCVQFEAKQIEPGT